MRTPSNSDGNYVIVVDEDSDSTTERFGVERGQSGSTLFSVHESGDVTVYGALRCEAAPVTIKGGAANASIARFKAGGALKFGVTQEGIAHFPNAVKIPSQTAADFQYLAPGTYDGELNIVIITESYVFGGVDTECLAVWDNGAWHVFLPQ